MSDSSLRGQRRTSQEMPCGTPTNWAVITFLLQIFWNSPFTIHMFWDLVISFPNSTWYFSDSQCLWIYLLFVFVFPSIVHHFTSSERILHHVPVISTIAGAGDAAQAAAAAAQEWNGAGIDEGIADGDATGHGCCTAMEAYWFDESWTKFPKNQGLRKFHDKFENYANKYQ